MLFRSKELHKIFKRRSTRPYSAKRFKRTIQDASKYIGKRMAKHFPTASGLVGADIFFGTVKYISDRRKFWFFVQYDDGDSEDVGVGELHEMLDLYEEHKTNDTFVNDRNTNSDRASSPPCYKPKRKLVTTDDEEDEEEEKEKATAYTNLADLTKGPRKTAEDSRQISEFKEEVEDDDGGSGNSVNEDETLSGNDPRESSDINADAEKDTSTTCD